MKINAVLLFAVSALCAFAQAPTVSGVLNGFSFTSQISPGVLASVFGSNLSGNNLQVTLNGTDCPVTFSSAAQLNIQVPWEAKIGAGSVVVEHDSLSSTPFAVTVTRYSPALVSANGSGSGTGVFLSGGTKLISTTNPANGGDLLVTYAVGLGATTPAATTGVVTPNPPPLYVTLGSPSLVIGKKAQILFSGLAPGVLATDQLNFILAPNTPVGTDTVDLTIGAYSTGLITIPIACLDVTTGVSVSKGPITNPSAGKYQQKVTITNTSGKALPARASLVLTGLTSSATLTDGGGATCPSSDGSPYRSFAFTGTGSAQTATFYLTFTDTTTGNITYGERVLIK